jgi:hemerythrin-like metal-binding protein
MISQQSIQCLRSNSNLTLWRETRMALLEWKDDYSVNVQKIDREHQQLFSMINALHEAIVAGEGSKVGAPILEDLVEYTREHFRYEESLMLRAKYPNYVQHKTQHDKLTKEVLDTLDDTARRKAVLSLTLLTFLIEWWQTHVLSCDTRYTAFMEAAGIH